MITKERENKMLTSSSKSRLAAMALMVLAVTTFMSTSAALATDVNVSGSVECAATPSTVTASAVTFGNLAKGASGNASLSPTITQGKNTNCADKTATVTGTIGSFSGGASAAEANRVVITLGSLSGGSFPISVVVPEAAPDGAFGATVTLTLANG